MAAVISHAVWPYFRFPVSLRVVEEPLSACGIVVSCETVRQWTLKFGQEIAKGIRRRLPRVDDKWHLNEDAVRIAGVRHWLWRAVDQSGLIVEVLVQRSRNRHAVKRLRHKLLKRPPRVMITDKLGRYAAAKQVIMLSIEHRQHKGLNNRAENLNQPTRKRERQMKRFKPARHAQRFLACHDQANNLFQLRRGHVTATESRTARTSAVAAWASVSGPTASA